MSGQDSMVEPTQVKPDYRERVVQVRPDLPVLDLVLRESVLVMMGLRVLKQKLGFGLEPNLH